ncbi:AAA family ATPase [Eubacteriales bacterium OttesenSCG-928-G02]|nr:AAA family ATPase [Eubacteriales bacterium OttesenSCG-928-G02]
MYKYKTIAFSNQKGGVGKTTSAINISACLAMKGNRVLLVDSDPQGNATSGLGINKRKTSSSVYDLLIGRAKGTEVINKTALQNLDCIPSSMDLVGAEIELVDSERREYKLKDALLPLYELYDFIIIDSPPSLGLVTLNALAASDAVVVPLLCEFYSLEGLSQLTRTIKNVKNNINPHLELLGVLINMYDGRLTLTSQVLEEIKKYFPDKIFKRPIPRNVKISEAPGYGQPICVYDKYSKGALAYDSLTDEFIDRCKGF